MNATGSRYAKTLARIQSGLMSRDELQQLGRNAKTKAEAGDHEAEEVLQALVTATCVDTEYVFLGFCPDAQFEKRQDLEWRTSGHCSFDFLEDKAQTSRFQRIVAGDLIVLKKRHEFGKTMKLYGHGRARSPARMQGGVLLIDVQWSNQAEVIEVPLLGCNTTVDVRSLEVLRTQAMPPSFFEWLKV
ncbi:hypothetical protein [Roseateles sp.]|uniref:hypothetical protein n=1 Tax=Roseateles sp. TaxID=1971397 RepID=UPI003D11EA8B